MSIKGYIEITVNEEHSGDYIIIEKRKSKVPLFYYNDDFYHALDCVIKDYTNQDCCGLMEITGDDLFYLEENEPEKYNDLMKNYSEGMKCIDSAIDEDLYGCCSIICY